LKVEVDEWLREEQAGFKKGIDREVLWKLLRHYDMPEKYITLIQKTYEKCTCRVIHNGVLSELFEMLTGVQQGCLLSPFLFLLRLDNQDGIQ